MLPASSLLVLVVTYLSSTCVSALYEDQVGKWDWKRSLIGSVDQVIPNHLSSQSSIIVSTGSSVIAALSVRNGSILYRHILEENLPINLIDLDDAHYGIKEHVSPGSLISISGNGRFVRKWDGRGSIVWEQSLPNEIFSSVNPLIFNVDQVKSEISVAEVRMDAVALYVYAIRSTKIILKSSDVILMDTSSVHNFIFATDSPLTLVGVHVKELCLKLLTPGSPVKSIPLKQLGLSYEAPESTTAISSLPLRLLSKQRTRSFINLNLNNEANVVLRVQNAEIHLMKILKKSMSISVVPVSRDEKYAAFVLISKPEALKSKQDQDDDQHKDDEYRIACFDLDSWKEIPALNDHFSLSLGSIVQQFHILPFLKVDSIIQTYGILITLQDQSVSLIFSHGSAQSWTRQESLASIITSVFVDYPLSELDASIEQAFLSSSNIVTQFVTRISSQVQQIQSLIRNWIIELKQLLIPNQSLLSQRMHQEQVNITRDYFGLRKLIVILTQAGKILAIDTMSGEIVWMIYDQDLAHEIQKQEVKDSVSLVVQRTSSYFPFPAVACIVTKTGLLFTFDPVQGIVMDKQRIGEEVKQMMQLPFTDETHIKGILMLTASNKAVIHPKTLLSTFLDHKDSFFMMTADPREGKLQGFSFNSVSMSNPSAQVIWSSSIPVDKDSGLSGLQVVFKRSNEQVHSQGRVLGDRNVLYKYLNPNLAAVAAVKTETTTSATDGSKTTSGLIDVYLIDAVTGRIIYSVSHKKSKGPVFVVHSENSIIYSYYNEKSRRTEISAIDLYEGLNQINSTTFSSIDQGTSVKPIVEHNTFIFPTGIRAMTDTVTEKGLTSKHLLIAIPSGGLLELPKAFLDPRRPLIPTAEHREEGLIPYIPELPIPSEGFINYNKSLMRVKSIETGSSGLESTCLLFTHGLDLFHSRVTPSKTFDILKDDFDHLLISAVLIIMIVIAYASKWAAAQKSLKSAWT